MSTGCSGQFGGAAGGNINYITKSGLDGFHGNAQYYSNGGAFNANYWFNNAFNIPRPFSIADSQPTPWEDQLRRIGCFSFLMGRSASQVPSTTQVTIPSHQFEDTTIKNIDSDSRFGAGSATYAFYRKIFDLYGCPPLGPGVSAVRTEGSSIHSAVQDLSILILIRTTSPPGRGCAVLGELHQSSRPPRSGYADNRHVDSNASRSDEIFYA